MRLVSAGSDILGRLRITSARHVNGVAVPASPSRVAYSAEVACFAEFGSG